MERIIKTLYANADENFRDFNSGLIPSVEKDRFIGVRTPILRKLARDIVTNYNWRDFIDNTPHKFFEENQLHAFIISNIRDFDTAVTYTNKFLPFIDNWATCDQMSPKIFAKNTDKLLPYIQKWIKSKHTYTVRFGVLCLMRYFLDSAFDTKYSDMVLNIKSDEYYVNMMRAWYFATGAAKHFDEILPYFNKLDLPTRNRAIQKALESYRVAPGHKVILKNLQN